MSRRRPALLIAAVVTIGAATACDPGATPVLPETSRAGAGGASVPGLSLQPPGLRPFNDQPWESVNGADWNYARRTSSRDAAIVKDATAPASPPGVLQITFTTDMAPNTEPGANWLGLPRVKEIYTGWWMKVSPDWRCSPAGCGKVTFLFTDGSGAVYTNLHHTSESAHGPPFRIGANTEWAPYGQRVWLPNVTTTHVAPGRWHHIEFYYRYETSPGASDGIIRWSVDGVLNGNHTNVRYPVAPFVEFLYAPTLQRAPAAEQYFYIDHTRISVR